VTAQLFPARAKPGEVITAAVRVRMADGWHTYGALPPRSPYRQLVVMPDVPPGWTMVGGIDAPEAEPSSVEPGVRTYSGDVVFLLRLRVPLLAEAGDHELAFEATFVVCDEGSCLPPDSKSASLTLTVSD
jgi:DsbC/DsbD-like thiol-disulfide interchange protein